MPYSSQLFSPAHPANQSRRTPPARYCCLDAYSKKGYILCATCPRRHREQMPDDDYDDDLPSPDWSQPEISRRMSPDFEGPLWQ